MSNKNLSASRKAMLWWFDWPANPYVTVSGSVEFQNAQTYLQRLSHAPAVTVHHLVMAAVARTLVDFPIANSRIIGKKIIREPDIGIGMPVNLLGHSAGKKLETTGVVVERVQSRSLRDIATVTHRTVRSEREGNTENPFIRALVGMVDKVPYPIVSGILHAMNGLRDTDLMAKTLFSRIPMTVGITNAGAPVDLPEGILFRAASISIPQRLLYVGTLWGIAPVQQEVFAIEGQALVRPALPISMVFDHRLFDGVLAGRILVRFGEIIRNPEKFFGEDGHRVIGE